MNIGSQENLIPGSARQLVLASAGNISVLVQEVPQHLLDDPALLVVQTSRRLPFATRVRVGRHLESSRSVFPAISALGSVMAGCGSAALEALERLNVEPPRRPSGLAGEGEVAILLDNRNRIPAEATVTTRARAAWSEGESQRRAEQLFPHGGC